MKDMYPASNTIVVQLVEDITAIAEEITVTDASAFPAAPNFATIGTDNNAEVIVYQGVDLGNNKLTGCLRGQSYTTARPWVTGAFVYHSWTAQLANNMMVNIRDISSNKANLSQLCNPNILHNWDFRNPVNQRGHTSYSTGGNVVYSIDRFHLAGGSGSVSIGNGSIGLTADTANFELGQRIENYGRLNGMPLTLSLDVGGTIYKGSAVVDTNVNSTPINVPIAATGFQLQLRIIPELSICAARIFAPGPSTGNLQDIRRIKLEVGAVSTLANDPPADYGVELAKCQRYFLRLATWNVGKIGTGGCDREKANILIPLPTRLRINPVMTYGNISDITIHTGGSMIAATSVTVGSIASNAIELVVYAEGLTSGNAGNLRLINSGYIDLDANL